MNDPKKETEFQTGSEVIYGLHGRCAITSIETKQVGGENISFYRLEPLIKNPIVKTTTKKDRAILLPVAGARKRGLRHPIGAQTDVDSIHEILGNKETYFELDAHWREVLPKLEACINAEGAIGLAKVLSFVHVRRAHHVVPPSDLVKFHESIQKLLAREISEVVGQTVGVVEEDIDRRLKAKLRPDQ